MEQPVIVKPYFPCLLGNGVDAILLDYSGSMSCDSGHLHMEQHQGAICAWYKATHRGISKVIPPLLQSTYTLFTLGGKTWYDAGGETWEVGEYDQQFDALRGILRTTVQASEFRLEVTSFITSGHVLVERYRILAAPDKPCAVGLNLTPPMVHWSNGLYDLRGTMRHAFRADPEARTIRCNLEVGGVRGRAALYVDAPVSAQSDYRGGKRLVVDDVAPGREFTKFVVLLDERDDPDYRVAIDRALDEVRALGYEEVLRRHEREALAFSGLSSVTLPDPWLTHVYNSALYNIRAHQNPYTGLISLGNYPQLWGGGICDAIDVFYPHKALLSANRLGPAEEAVAGYLEILPLARHYAEQLGHQGAFLPWFMTYEGEATDFSHPLDLPNLQKSNNGAAVMQAWDLYDYTRDEAMLRRHWPVIRDISTFLVSSLVEWHGSEARIREGTGADEVVDRANDSLTLIVTMKAIEAMVQGARILGEGIDPVYLDLPASLRRGLQRNFRGDVLMPYLGATGITSTILYSYLLNLPEGLPSGSVEAGLRGEGKWGLTNPHNYRNLVWPWAEAKAAAVLAHLGDERAHRYLQRAARFTSELGAMPEKIRPDRFWIGFYYTTCAGAYAWALNSMLANARGDRVQVLAGAPVEWSDLAFENLRVQPGLLVSAEAKGGALARLAVRNDSAARASAQLSVPERWLGGATLPERLDLAPGETWEASLEGRRR